MADMPAFVPHDSQGKIPKWVLYGGGIAAILGLVVLIKNQQSGGSGTPSTVANAGTSINAALGSLQEAELQTQGMIGAAQNQEGTDSAAIQNNQATIMGGIGGLSDALGSMSTANAAGFSGLGTQVAGVGDQVGQVGSQLGDLNNSVNSQFAGLNNNMMSGFQIISGQNDALSQDIAGVSSQVGGLQNSTNELKNTVAYNANYMNNSISELKHTVDPGLDASASHVTTAATGTH